MLGCSLSPTYVCGSVVIAGVNQLKTMMPLVRAQSLLLSGMCADSVAEWLITVGTAIHSSARTQRVNERLLAHLRSVFAALVNL